MCVCVCVCAINWSPMQKASRFVCGDTLRYCFGARGYLTTLTVRKVITECRRNEWLWAKRLRSCEQTRNSQRVHVSLKALTATVCGLCQIGLYRFWALMGFTVCIRVNGVPLIILSGSIVMQKTVHKKEMDTFCMISLICFHVMN